MVRGVFVTGTDTGVGKTVVSAALIHRYRNRARLRYWKPVQTGIEHDDDTATVQRLAECNDAELLRSGVRLHGAVAPYLAAERAGVDIRISELKDAVNDARFGWIVEGAGGVMVPINATDFMADLMAALCLPVVVVARSTLGTINHTLLTLEVLRRRNLHVAGVVVAGEKNDDNEAALEKYGRVHVLGAMPHFDVLGAEALKSWAISNLDREDRLAAFLS